MTRADDYLARAAICERLAKGATDPEMKRLLEDLANQWRDLATRIWETRERPFR
jgi:hypothetical protein